MVTLFSTPSFSDEDDSSSESDDSSRSATGGRSASAGHSATGDRSASAGVNTSFDKGGSTNGVRYISKSPQVFALHVIALVLSFTNSMIFIVLTLPGLMFFILSVFSNSLS